MSRAASPTAAHFLIAVLLAGLAAGLQAQTLPISGSVVDGAGRPLLDVRVELVSASSFYDQALLAIEGRSVAEPAAMTETGDDGRFTLTAPEAGFWQLFIRQPGHPWRILSWTDEPLLAAARLPPAVIEDGVATAVRVVDAAGEAAAGARVRVSERRRPRWRRQITRWSSFRPEVRADEDGRVSILLPADARTETRTETRTEIELHAWRNGDAPAVPVPAAGDALELRLAPGTERRLRITDDRRQPRAGVAVLLAEEGWPAGLSDDEGRISVYSDIESTRVMLALPDGRIRHLRLVGSDGIDEELVVTIPPPRVITGRVLSAADRRPISEAWVYAGGGVGSAVRTDSRGSFEILAGEEATQLSAVARGHLEATADLPAGTVSRTLILEPTLDLEGRVTSGGREPLEEVTIVAESYPAGRGGSFASSPARFARTGPDGDFALSRLAAGASWAITASKAGYAPTQLRIVDLEEARARGPVTLVLESGAEVSGRLVGADGRPVVGASLELAVDDAREISMGSFVPTSEELRLTTESTEEGHFSIPRVPQGRLYGLEIRAAGYAVEHLAAVEVAEGQPSLDLGVIELETGIALTGSVFDADGVPLAEAEVRLGEERRQRVSVIVGDPRSESLSGSDGGFSFPDRREGELVTLNVSRRGYVARSLSGIRVTGGESIEVELQPAVGVRGRVVDPSGTGVASATVRIGREGGTGSYGGRLFHRWESATQTDAEGRFELEDIEPGQVRLEAQAPGWLAAETGELELPSGRDTEGLEIELAPGATIEGRVLQADGTPASRASVTLEESGGARSRTFSDTDGDGYYRIDGVEPGRRVVAVYSRNGGHAVEELVVARGTNRLDFALPPGFEISGRVVSLGGAPVAEALVSIEGAVGRGGSERTRADGTFRIREITNGTYRVTAIHRDFATAKLSEPLRVDSAPVSGLEIRLARGTELRGTLSGLDRRELSATRVTAIHTDAFYLQGWVEEDGSYRIDRLAPGLWRVMAITAEGRRAEEAIEVSPGEREVVLDIAFDDGLMLTGRVLARGQPLDGATLRLTGIDVTGSASGRSDYLGRFELEAPVAGLYRLEAIDFSSGLRHSEEVEIRRDVEVTVEIEGMTIRGTVFSQGSASALGGVSVSLTSVGNDDRLDTFGQGATTDESGRFTLRDVSAGTYRLRLSKPGFAEISEALDVRPAEDLDGLEFTLIDVEGLSLTIAMPDGGPVPRISWALLDAFGSVVAHGSEIATSSGRLTLETVPDGHWTLMLQGLGAAVHSVGVDAPDDLEVRLPAPAHLTIRVDDLTDEPSTAATLRVRSDLGEPVRFLTGNGALRDSWLLSAGRVVLDHLPAGRWLLSISTPDERSWERSVTLRSGANDEVVF